VVWKGAKDEGADKHLVTFTCNVFETPFDALGSCTLIEQKRRGLVKRVMSASSFPLNAVLSAKPGANGRRSAGNTNKYE